MEIAAKQNNWDNILKCSKWNKNVYVYGFSDNTSLYHKNICVYLRLYYMAISHKCHRYPTAILSKNSTKTENIFLSKKRKRKKKLRTKSQGFIPEQSQNISLSCSRCIMYWKCKRATAKVERWKLFFALDYIPFNLQLTLTSSVSVLYCVVRNSIASLDTIIIFLTLYVVLGAAVDSDYMQLRSKRKRDFSLFSRCFLLNTIIDTGIRTLLYVR